jgi:hypothetical protein
MPLTMTEIALREFNGVVPQHIEDQALLDDYHSYYVWLQTVKHFLRPMDVYRFYDNDVGYHANS